ncbi:MAG: ribosome silencing factor [Elusimicrobiota bacterium]
MSPTPQQQGRHFKNIATQAALAADDKKGEKILLLHIRPVSSIADYLLLVSATSSPHMRAIEEAIRMRLKDGGVKINHRDGRQSDVWRVLDYGGLLVHLMHPKARDFYALDKLFHDARPVEWMPQPEKKKPAVKKTKKKPASEKKAGAKKKKTKAAGKKPPARRRAHG